jgi:hypothetical protein
MVSGPIVDGRPLPAGARVVGADPTAERPLPPGGSYSNAPPPAQSPPAAQPTPSARPAPSPSPTPDAPPTPLPPGGMREVLHATPRPQVTAGLQYSNAVEKTDLLNGQRTSQALIDGLGALERSHRIVVTSVRSDHHDDGPAGHAGGKATDVGAVDGVTIGNNPQSRKFLEDAIASGAFAKIGTTGVLANDTHLQALAQEHGVALFTDEGTGPHVHLQVGDQPPRAQALPAGKSAAQSVVPAIKHVAESAYEVANKLWVEGVARLKSSALDPLGAAMNAELTPARFLDTVITQGVKPEAFAHAFQNALNPGEGDTGYNVVTERILRWIQQHDPEAKGSDYDRAVDAIVHNTVGRVSPAVAAKVTELQNKTRDFAYQFVSQSLADPVTYLPIVGLLGDIAKASKAMDLLAASAKAAGGTKAGRPLVAAATAMRAAYTKALTPVLRGMEIFHQRPELDAALEPHAKAAHIGYEHKNIHVMHHELGEGDAHLIDSNRPGLKGVKTSAKGYVLPSEIRQRYLLEAWRYGTPEMRAEAERLGYKPTPADEPWKARPEGLVDYNLREDYQYLGKVGSNLDESPAFKKYRANLPRVATFEHERVGNYAKIDADQYKRVKARLALGRNTVWQRRAKNETAQYIATHGGAKGLDLAAKDAPEKFGQFIDGLTTGPARYNSWMRVFGRLGTQSVQGTFLPHALNNVGTLSFLQSPIGLGRAIGYMGKGVSEAQRTRLQNLGSIAEYTVDVGNVWSKLPVSKQLLEYGQKTLSEMELAYRQGLLDELDRTWGPSFDHKAGVVTDERLEMQKGQAIRDAVVDYRNVPLVIAWMEAAGAPFAAFFGGLTKAVGRAALHHPERVAAVQRGTRDVQEDYGVTIPNPVNTFAKLAFNAPKTVLQHIGPIGGGTLEALSEFVHPLDQVIADNISRWGGPWLSQIPDFFNLPYPQRGTSPGEPTPWEGLWHALFGIYPYSPPSQSKQKQIGRSEMRAEGE